MEGTEFMSELLHNMSAPPTSQVKFEKVQLKEYIAFTPYKLALLLSAYGLKDEEISVNVKKYVDTHPQVASIIERPTGYMIAETIEDDDPVKVSDRLRHYSYIECDNLELLIAVFCSTVGDLYIPNRTLSFEKSKFNKVLLFPKEEVNS